VCVAALVKTSSMPVAAPLSRQFYTFCTPDGRTRTERNPTRNASRMRAIVS